MGACRRSDIITHGWDGAPWPASGLGRVRLALPHSLPGMASPVARSSLPVRGCWKTELPARFLPQVGYCVVATCRRSCPLVGELASLDRGWEGGFSRGGGRGRQPVGEPGARDSWSTAAI